MSDLAGVPAWTADVGQPLLRAEVPPEHIALAVDRGPDPLEHGFDLAGGVLAPLPAAVRLPHEGDDGDEDRDPPGT